MDFQSFSGSVKKLCSKVPKVRCTSFYFLILDRFSLIDPSLSSLSLSLSLYFVDDESAFFLLKGSCSR